MSEKLPVALYPIDEEKDRKSPSDMMAWKLKEKIVGQDEAIDALAVAFMKARLRDPRRPVASLMFLGPTGVGKTETAETLAESFARQGEDPNIVRIDCAQYAQGHEVANLVGAPPGYVGREQKPALDKDIIESPGSVTLFDEIEKGHRKLHNYNLQMMEGKGVKLMSTGETVNFNNTTLIFTSNVGAGEVQDALTDSRIGFHSEVEGIAKGRVETIAMNALKKQFAPEFINRLDDVVVFNALTDEQLEQVIDNHVAQANERYHNMGNMRIQLSPDLKRHIVESAEMRREFGARPVLRQYEKIVESKLSKMLPQLAAMGTIYAEIEADGVKFYTPGISLQSQEE